MFSIDDVVIYTTYGICKINNIIEYNGQKTYVLSPLGETKTEMKLPVESPLTKLRLFPLMEKNDIVELINEIPFMEPYWIDRDNDRKTKFSDIIKSGDRRETLKVIKCIRKHIIDIKDKGRKLHQTDKNCMKDAEKLLIDEFSYVLNIERNQMEIMLNTELEK